MRAKRTSRLYIQTTLAKVLLTIFITVFILSCKDEDELLLDSTILKGTWVEIEPADLVQFAGENHIFIFNKDSFYLKLRSWTDVVYQDEEGNLIDGDQFAYGKGEFSLNGNRISFNGKLGFDSSFTEPNDISDLSPFQPTFNYELESSHTIVLNPESEYESITLVKD